MCQLLDIPRSSLYYHLKNDSQKKKHDDSDLINLIKEIFKNSRNNYGSRKIKIELAKLGHIVSKRRIRRIMQEKGLVSSYTVKQYKVYQTVYTDDNMDNKLEYNFNQKRE